LLKYIETLATIKLTIYNKYRIVINLLEFDRVKKLKKNKGNLKKIFFNVKISLSSFRS